MVLRNARGNCILDTFAIARRKDEERWGKYQTKRMVLECYDALKGVGSLMEDIDTSGVGVRE